MIFTTIQRNFRFIVLQMTQICCMATKISKSLEETVSSELAKVADWLNANKLTLNAKKSNFVIFRPYQRKMDLNSVIQFKCLIIVITSVLSLSVRIM